MHVLLLAKWSNMNSSMRCDNMTADVVSVTEDDGHMLAVQLVTYDTCSAIVTALFTLEAGMTCNAEAPVCR